MRDNIKTPLVIFSAEREGLSEYENARRTDEVRGYLRGRGIPFNEAEGVWEGNSEVSFIIHERELTEVLEAVLFAAYEQDAILVTDINGAAYLQFEKGGERVLQGAFVEVASEVGLAAYTKYGSRVYTIVSSVEV
jgi:hypothetical protein